MNRVSRSPGAAPGGWCRVLMEKYDEYEFAADAGHPGDDRDGVRPGADTFDLTDGGSVHPESKDEEISQKSGTPRQNLYHKYLVF
jgi:hypothetical protein